MVFVLDRHQKPLMPCTEKRARQLLKSGRTVIHRIAPFPIRLKDRATENPAVQSVGVQWDPGSQTTGVAFTLDGARDPKVLFFGEIVLIAPGLPKASYYDALRVDEGTPDHFTVLPAYVGVCTATRRGIRQMCGTDKRSFPIRHRSRQKRHFGVPIGVLRGKYNGVHVGWVMMRTSASCVQGQNVTQGILYKHSQVLHRGDGWSYERKPASA